MRELLSSLFCEVFHLLYPLLPKNMFTDKLNGYVSMKRLLKSDPVQWRVEMARRIGAKIGKNCRLYSLNMFSEPYLIEIGDNVIVSGEVIFITHDGGVYLFMDEAPDIYGHFGKIKIGNNCFIGMGAIILPNVEIGDNCIIGAGAVVMDSVPDNSVVAGNPAKIIFKTSMYKHMKLSSKATLRDIRYAFPNENNMPESLKREKLHREIGSLQIRRSKK